MPISHKVVRDGLRELGLTTYKGPLTHEEWKKFKDFAATTTVEHDIEQLEEFAQRILHRRGCRHISEKSR